MIQRSSGPMTRRAIAAPAMDVSAPLNGVRTRKKPIYPIDVELRHYRRKRELPVTYERLCHFHESHPLGRCIRPQHAL